MNVRVELVTGGMDQNKQTLLLSEKPHVIVATPGRLAELLSRFCKYSRKFQAFFVARICD